MQLTWLDTFYAHTAFKHTLFALHCLPCALVTIYTSGASKLPYARARTVYAPITRDNQRLRALRARARTQDLRTKDSCTKRQCFSRSLYQLFE